MSGLTLFRKEVAETVKTSRIYVIPGLFLFFGLTSPILTKLMPEIIKSIGGSAGGVQIVIPPQTAVDAFLQFLKNLTQIGILGIILTLMGTVAREKEHGTAVLVLTKPASRAAFVVAKAAAAGLLVVFATALGYAATLYYTLQLFTGVPVAASAWGTLVYLVYALFITAATVAASAVARNQVAAAGFTLGVFFLVSLLPVFGPAWVRWTPGGLPSLAGQIIGGAAAIGDAVPAMGVSLALGVLFVGLGIAAFRRQEI